MDMGTWSTPLDDKSPYPHSARWMLESSMMKGRFGNVRSALPQHLGSAAEVPLGPAVFM